MEKLKTWELNRLSVEAAKTAEKIPVIAVLDNIRSGLNVGSIFRTADAFAIERVVLCGITAQPPHREILKTALGSTESVDWEYWEHTAEAIHYWREKGYLPVALEQTNASMLIGDFFAKNTQPLCLVFGNEVEGVSDAALKVCQYAVEIPQYGSKHSLNVAVSAGIALWECAKK